jgi:hypothetical protein
LWGERKRSSKLFSTFFFGSTHHYNFICIYYGACLACCTRYDQSSSKKKEPAFFVAVSSHELPFLWCSGDDENCLLGLKTNKKWVDRKREEWEDDYRKKYYVELHGDRLGDDLGDLNSLYARDEQKFAVNCNEVYGIALNKFSFSAHFKLSGKKDCLMIKKILFHDAI